MTNISLRLPDELAEQLEREMKLARRARSEILREALEGYLAGKARERLMAEMVREARVLYGDPMNLEDARRIEADFLAAENEVPERADGAHGGAEQKWWK
jgi:metal-responsive CopG/Arc/MetJ family transcriptional regulator